MKDAYKLFMDEFDIKEAKFIEFGIRETIVIKPAIVEKEWEKLKKNVVSGENDVFVRGYGRDAKGTRLYMDLYRYLFKNGQFLKDGTNNANPKKMLENCTRLKRTEKVSNEYKSIRNFQVSHIFGRTKNPFAFTAPWNIAYVPKIVDPFTGHESKGELTTNFLKEFNNYFYELNKSPIEEFNSIMIGLQSKIESYLDNLDNFYGDDFTAVVLQKFKTQVLLDFKIIEKVK